jgi:Ca2+-binding RTX toxin-like protein
MRRATILLAVMGLAVLLSAGAALAASVRCDGGVCRGTAKSDTMRGSQKTDRMYGGGGFDIMYGYRDNDVMLGGTGFDTMDGGYGSDRMYGQTQNDTMRGGPAHDRMYGGPGRDALYGENGADYIVAAGDRETDSISCGLGSDTAVIDAVADMTRATLIEFIEVTSCERVLLR